MTYEAFDQTHDEGWRAMAKQGNYALAARTIEDYLEANLDLTEGQQRVLHFHAAQMFAFAGQTDDALWHLPFSFEPEDGEPKLILWNDYVAATEAFLRGNYPELLAARERIANGPECGGTIANLSVVDRLLANFDRPYSQAY